jgi:hypothetical protein
MAAQLLDDAGGSLPWALLGPGRAGQGDRRSQGDKRSAEDAREHARRLRSLPADHVLGDVLFSLLHAAQVKLGRLDARLLMT